MNVQIRNHRCVTLTRARLAQDLKHSLPQRKTFSPNARHIHIFQHASRNISSDLCWKINTKQTLSFIKSDIVIRCSPNLPFVSCQAPGVANRTNSRAISIPYHRVNTMPFAVIHPFVSFASSSFPLNTILFGGNAANNNTYSRRLFYAVATKHAEKPWYRYEGLGSGSNVRSLFG